MDSTREVGGVVRGIMWGGRRGGGMECVEGRGGIVRSGG